MADTTTNPKKRPPPSSSPNIDATAQKRPRHQTARQIATTSTNPTIKAGVLDIPSFIASRQCEIKNLVNAMASSKKMASKRAFQSVPRALRRRTASHNPSRVPGRLRTRAIQEMKDDKTPVHKFSKRQKKPRDWVRKQTAIELRKASKKKEIVDWVKDGMKGEKPEAVKDGELRNPPRPHSRYRKRQREKTWLPTHVWHAKRAHMGIRWKFAVPESCNEKSFRATARAAGQKGGIAWDTSFFSHIMLSGEAKELAKVIKGVVEKKIMPKKVTDGQRSWETWIYESGGYPKSPIAPVVIVFSPPDETTHHQSVIIRVHPSAFLSTWSTLLSATKSAPTKITIEDLRFELGSIAIHGPSATDGLLNILHPSDATCPVSKLFLSLHGVTNPAALPPGTILAFNITDPRLHFPPSRPPPTPSESVIFSATANFPSTPLTSPIPLFSRPVRSTATRLQPSQKRINARKTTAGPGVYPPPVPQDPSIPVLLIAHENSWTVILPWKWVHPVWYTLMHSHFNIRFGGLREMRQLCFTRAEAWFPGDYPGTEAGGKWAQEVEAERMLEWEKKPKQKRVNYEKTGEVGDWWKCDWSAAMKGMEEEEDVEAQVEDPDSMVDIDTSDVAITTETTEQGGKARKEFYYLPNPDMVQKNSEDAKFALVTVRVKLLGKGAPKDCARIWMVAEGSNIKKPPPQIFKNGETMKLVGFLTTGNYSLKEGKAVGVGAVSWGLVGGKKKGLCVVKDVGDGTGRWARWEVV